MFDRPTEGWVVDAATEGNPGLSEYRCMDLETGRIIFHKKIGYSTNNIAEFLAVVHAIALIKQNGMTKTVYTDSVTAISWVVNKGTNSSLERNEFTEQSIDMSKRAVAFLNTVNIEKPNQIVNLVGGVKLMKWMTQSWGEIPADFGRKKK